MQNNMLHIHRHTGETMKKNLYEIKDDVFDKLIAPLESFYDKYVRDILDRIGNFEKIRENSDDAMLVYHLTYLLCIAPNELSYTLYKMPFANNIMPAISQAQALIKLDSKAVTDHEPVMPISSIANTYVFITNIPDIIPRISKYCHDDITVTDRDAEYIPSFIDSYIKYLNNVLYVKDYYEASTKEFILLVNDDCLLEAIYARMIMRSLKHFEMHKRLHLHYFDLNTLTPVKFTSKFTVSDYIKLFKSLYKHEHKAVRDRFFICQGKKYTTCRFYLGERCCIISTQFLDINLITNISSDKIFEFFKNGMLVADEDCFESNEFQSLAYVMESNHYDDLKNYIKYYIEEYREDLDSEEYREDNMYSNDFIDKSCTLSTLAMRIFYKSTGIDFLGFLAKHGAQTVFYSDKNMREDYDLFVHYVHMYNNLGNIFVNPSLPNGSLSLMTVDGCNSMLEEPLQSQFAHNIMKYAFSTALNEYSGDSFTNAIKNFFDAANKCIRALPGCPADVGFLYPYVQPDSYSEEYLNTILGCFDNTVNKSSFSITDMHDFDIYFLPLCTRFPDDIETLYRKLIISAFCDDYNDALLFYYSDKDKVKSIMDKQGFITARLLLGSIAKTLSEVLFDTDSSLENKIKKLNKAAKTLRT